MFILNVDASGFERFTKKLEELHRSALPVAVRGTLNKAAFNVKTDTMPSHAKSDFVNRVPNFFKANSKVDMAKGFAMGQMKATIGMVSTSLRGGNNFAVKDLEQQEKGGTIGGRSFIPTDSARGGNKSRPVLPRNRLTAIQNIVKAKKARGKNDRERFVRSLIFAGKGGYLLTKTKSKEILFRVDSIKRPFKLTPLYVHKENDKVSVSARNFMRDASLETRGRLNLYYAAEAERQINRLQKK